MSVRPGVRLRDSRFTFVFHVFHSQVKDNEDNVPVDGSTVVGGERNCSGFKSHGHRVQWNRKEREHALCLRQECLASWCRDVKSVVFS